MLLLYDKAFPHRLSRFPESSLNQLLALCKTWTKDEDGTNMQDQVQ